MKTRDRKPYVVPTLTKSYPRFHNLTTTQRKAEVISVILSHLQSPSLASSTQTILVSVHLFAILVLSNTQEALFTGGPALAWKWAKPNAPHWQRKCGFWKPDLEEVIEDAEWSVGKGVRLLLQGVTEERKEELRQGMILFPASK
jgi:hypothetical protein